MEPKICRREVRAASGPVHHLTPSPTSHDSVKTQSSSVSCVGPVYLVIFCYWVGPVPYLELFGVGPVEKNTLYHIGQLRHDDIAPRVTGATNQPLVSRHQIPWSR